VYEQGLWWWTLGFQVNSNRAVSLNAALPVIMHAGPQVTGSWPDGIHPVRMYDEYVCMYV
jgi:hypothetical protein